MIQIMEISQTNTFISKNIKKNIIYGLTLFVRIRITIQNLTYKVYQLKLYIISYMHYK